MHISELANRHVDISIHALHEESEIDLDKQGKATVFQSTLSMRRAKSTSTSRAKPPYFNPRSP